MNRLADWTLSNLILLSIACGPLALRAEIPLECYQKAGLIPTPNAPRVSALADESLWIQDSWTSPFDSPATCMLNLRGTTQINNLSIVLENTGAVNIVNPWIVYNRKRDWFDSNSMLKECLEGETDPKKRAFRIWKFILDNRYHYHPAEGSMDLHSPPRFLNVYGYGYCDDSAKNAEGLFILAGFQNARCWELSGHVVPEVYYNNAWKMLDSDVEVFYPMDDNLTVAAVQDIAAHPEWIERVHTDNSYVRGNLLSIYGTTENNSTFHGQWDLAINMAMTLRPGERFERSWTNWGKYHALDILDIPPVFGNGSHIYAPDFSKSHVSQGFETFSNIETVGESGVTPAAHLKSAAATGRIVCKMTTPYVFVGGAVECDVVAKSSSDVISITFSRDGASWYYLGYLTGPFAGTKTLALDALINPLKAAALQTFYIQATLTGRQKTSVGLNSLKVTGEIQLAPAALPALEPAIENILEVRFAPAAGASLLLTHNYERRDYIAAPIPPEQPLTPYDNDTVTTLTPLLRWNTAATSSTIKQREIMISWDSPGVLPVSPPLWKSFQSTAPEWRVPEGWLLPGKRYYWRVRAQDALGQWSNWTGPWTFQTLAAAETPRGLWMAF